MKKFLIGLALLLSGCSTHHYHFYPSHEERKAVRAHSTEKIKPSIEFRIKERNGPSLEAIVDMLENVPDKIQENVNNRGGLVVIFEGKLTDNPEMARLKGKPAGPQVGMWEKGQIMVKAPLWDDKPGAYYDRTAFIQQDYAFTPADHQLFPFYTVELHEYGHMVDALYGWISKSKEFTLLFEKYRGYSYVIDDERFSCKEFFASRFSEYYHSDQSRSVLGEKFPEVQLFFKTWEEKLLKAP